MVLKILRRCCWRRRLAAARAWQQAERAQAAERSAAIRRILDLAAGHPPEQPPDRIVATWWDR